MAQITHQKNGDSIDKLIDTGNAPNDPARVVGWRAYRRLLTSVNDGKVLNDGSDVDTVTVSLVDGLEVARGTDPANATVLDYDGDVNLRVDGAEVAKTLTNGTVSFDLTTERPAGSEIVVKAVNLMDHPAESDSATIKVIQA